MDWILVICIAFNTEHSVCGQLRQVRYPNYAYCAVERNQMNKQRDVSFVYCRPAREPELVK